MTNIVQHSHRVVAALDISAVNGAAGRVSNDAALAVHDFIADIKIPANFPQEARLPHKLLIALAAAALSVFKMQIRF